MKQYTMVEQFEHPKKAQIKARVYFQLGYAKLEQLGDDFQALHELAAQAG